MMATYFSKAGFIDKPLMKYTIRKESLSHFTDGDVKKRKINALLGYKDIRNYLINSFFQGDEKEFWLKQNELLYARVFMKLAVDYNDKSLIKENYYKIQQLKEVNINDMIIYYQLINKFIFIVLKVYRKLLM